MDRLTKRETKTHHNHTNGPCREEGREKSLPNERNQRALKDGVGWNFEGTFLGMLILEPTATQLGYSKRLETSLESQLYGTLYVKPCLEI